MGYFISFNKLRRCVGLSCIAALLAVFFVCRNSSIAEMPSSSFYCDFQVIGYYPDYWGIPIPEIRYDKLTQVVFFSIYPNADGSLNTSQINLSRQATFVNAADANEVNVSICIGGWDLSDNFAAVTANATTRTAFIAHLTDYCIDHHYDGIVLDWEPVLTITDRDNYSILIQELKAALVPHHLSLTVAVSALGSELNESSIGSIDWLHVMGYDMGTIHSTYEDALAGVSHWETFGFPKSKIILGLPFYGREENWWNEWSYEPYDEIIARYQPGPEIDEVNGIYFNGINTIKAKTQYMIENDYGGVMLWEITEDTNDETSLLTAISNEVLFRSPPDFNCDSLINGIDLNHLAIHWLMSDCQNSNAWCNNSDLDQSGNVTLQDIALFGQKWTSSE